ncbi:Alpha/Beta hydrolase protein [Circinella umbellata]|nr:Alpha/Beta hydrolase protein [Circinella umbellata]
MRLTGLLALALPIVAALPTSTVLVKRQQNNNEIELSDHVKIGIEEHGPLPRGTEILEGGTALEVEEYPSSVEAALNGTRAQILNLAVRDPTEAEMDDLEFHTALASNVYCSAVMNGRWICPHCSRTNHLEIVETFDTIVYDTNVLVARDDKKKIIYVVFRGSASLQNWLADMNIVLTNYPGVTSARVHAGFYNSYKDVQSRLMSTIKSQVSKYADYAVHVTGHSLGGATALFNALDLHENGITNIRLITQGQPRTGNKAFANYVVGTGISYMRAVNERDVVPHVPDIGYTHAGDEFWEKTGLLGGVQVCASSDGLETDDCANSIAPFTSFTDHTRYFGMTIGLCLL